MQQQLTNEQKNKLEEQYKQGVRYVTEMIPSVWDSIIDMNDDEMVHTKANMYLMDLFFEEQRNTSAFLSW